MPRRTNTVLPTVFCTVANAARLWMVRKGVYGHSWRFAVGSISLISGWGDGTVRCRDAPSRIFRLPTWGENGTVSLSSRGEVVVGGHQRECIWFLRISVTCLSVIMRAWIPSLFRGQLAVWDQSPVRVSEGICTCRSMRWAGLTSRVIRFLPIW